MKKVEHRTWWFAGCAMCLAVGYAAVAQLGCSGGCADAADDCGAGGSSGTGGTSPAGGTGATAGTGGTSGTMDAGSTGGTAGAAGSAGTGGEAGSGGTSPDSGRPICGGIAGLTCPDTMYCDYPGDMCGEGDMHVGDCMPRPQMCSKDCPGACGCDGKFYCNVCEAQRAGYDGVSGACPDTGAFR